MSNSNWQALSCCVCVSDSALEILKSCTGLKKKVFLNTHGVNNNSTRAPPTVSVPLRTDFFRKLLFLHHCSSPFYQPRGLIRKVGDSLLKSYIWPAMLFLPERETEWWPSKTRVWVLSEHTHTHTESQNLPKTLATKPRGKCEAKAVRNQGVAYKLGPISCCSRWL